MLQIGGDRHGSCLGLGFSVKSVKSFGLRVVGCRFYGVRVWVALDLGVFRV